MAFKKYFTILCIFLLVNQSLQTYEEMMINDKSYQVYTAANKAATTTAYNQTKSQTKTAAAATTQSYAAQKTNNYSKTAQAAAQTTQYQAKPAQSAPVKPAQSAPVKPAYSAPVKPVQAPAQQANTYSDNSQYSSQDSQYDGQYESQYDGQYSPQSGYAPNTSYGGNSNSGNAYDFRSAEYQRLSRSQKLRALWQKIIQNDNPGPIPTYEEFEQIMVQDPSITLNYESDVLPLDRKKRIHKQGVVQQVRWVAEKNTPYTGLFQTGADSCIARYSLANAIDFKYIDRATASEAYNQFSPSIAIKCLIDGYPSANIFGMYSFNGQSSWNWFKNNLYNHLPDPYGLTLDMIHKKFSTATPYTQILGSTSAAKYQQNGFVVKNPYVPFKIIFIPNERHQLLWGDDYIRNQDWVYQLKKIKQGEVVYTVWAIDDPATGCSQKIGSILANSYALTSTFADENLFFRHDAWDKDLVLRPEWEAYSSSRNPDPVEYKAMGQCPIQKARECFSSCRAEAIVCRAQCGFLIIDELSTEAIIKPTLTIANRTTATLMEMEEKTEQTEQTEKTVKENETTNLAQSSQSPSATCIFACEQEQCLATCSENQRECEEERSQCRPQCRDQLQECLDTCSVLTTPQNRQQCQQTCRSRNVICLAVCTLRSDTCLGVCQAESYTGLALYQNTNSPCQNLCTANELICVVGCGGVNAGLIAIAAQDPTTCIATCREQTRTCRTSCQTCQPTCMREQQTCVQGCAGNPACITECSNTNKACLALCNYGIDCNLCSGNNGVVLHSSNNYNNTSSYSHNSRYSYGGNSGYQPGSQNYGSNPSQLTPCQRSCQSARSICYASCTSDSDRTTCIQLCDQDFTSCNQLCPECLPFCQSLYQSCYTDTSNGACGDTNQSSEERACACSICQSLLTECTSFCEASTRLDCLGFNFASSPIVFGQSQFTETPSCIGITIEGIQSRSGLRASTSRGQPRQRNPQVLNKILGNKSLNPQILKNIRTIPSKQLGIILRQQKSVVGLAKSKNIGVSKLMKFVTGNDINRFSLRTVGITQQAFNTAKYIQNGLRSKQL